MVETQDQDSISKDEQNSVMAYCIHYAEALTPKGLNTLRFDENIITRLKTEAKILTGD